jgi:hypothetical protein
LLVIGCHTRGRWCHIIVLNVHAPTEDKTDDVKHSFYEELERVFDKFPKYHMKILLGGFIAEVGRTISLYSSKTVNNRHYVLFLVPVLLFIC